MSPDNDVLPLVISHFQDRFNDQPWLIYDARRHYGYYYDGSTATRITFEDETQIPFSLENGKLNDAVLSDNDQPAPGPVAHLLQSHLYPRTNEPPQAA